MCADRDATEPNVLVDRVYRGKPSKLLLHADRNGFFYVLDRTNGAVLLAKPFLRRVDWAVGDRRRWTAGREGPARLSGRRRELVLHGVLAGHRAVLLPGAGGVRRQADRLSRSNRPALSACREHRDRRRSRGKCAQPGPARAKTWSGVLATATGLLFYGQPNGGFVAVDQRDGRTLWQFPTNVRMKASPMTFSVGGQQYVVVAAGPNILCFGL